MIKRIVTITLIAVVLCMATVFASENGWFEVVDYKIKIGNNAVELQNPIFEHNDRVYVSIRSICEAMGIPVDWKEDSEEIDLNVQNKKVPVSDKTQLKEEGVIPDEETALTVGKAILEKYAGVPMEYETEDKIYYLTVDFNEQNNYWVVTQWFDMKVGGWAASGIHLPTIRLSRATGEVLYINTYSSLNH